MSRRPLKKKNFKGLKEYELRVLLFNPVSIYKRVKINKYKRTQNIGMEEMFPRLSPKCACGCGKELQGRRTKWATDECMLFAANVLGIINGDAQIISKWLRIYFGQWACCKCGLCDSYKEYKNGLCVSTIHKDHILAVVNGGGGCWLSNYQLLCEDCHFKKTKKDLKKLKNS